ncbi:MAG: S10 family peptidase [Rhodanobacteraceae bacterium]
MKASLAIVAVVMLAAFALPGYAAQHAKPGSSAPSQAGSTAVPKTRKVVTHASVEIDGKTIRYTATAGTIVLRNDKNQPTGSMFYVAYTEDGVRDLAKRPVTFLYNDGPGASSNWLTMSGLGPYKVDLVNGAATPPAPYSVKPSHESTENDRWNSPLFLYGESYGTTRSAALAYYLQDQGIAVNGVILQSSILNYFDLSPGSDDKYIFTLPSFEALAWYHNKLPHKPASMPEFVEQARKFADGPYAQALREGNKLPKAQMDAMAEKLHGFTGLPVDYLERANLRVTSAEFRKELMLPEREHIGRYDGRYVASDVSAIASKPTFDPSDQQISPALNQGYLWYVHHVLKWETDREYVGLNFKAFKDWDWDHTPPGSFGNPFRKQRLPDVALDIAAAMRKNPYLRVLSENGYFDLATPFHATEYDLDHVTLSPKLQKHIEFAYFDSGHPIYINPNALKAMHGVLDRFYASTLKADAAAYGAKH